MKRKNAVVVIVVAAGIFLGLFLIISIAVTLITYGDPNMIPGDKVAVIEISGAIYNCQEIIDQIHRYDEDDSVKAIILRINSPGGVVAPVQEIHKELTRVHKKIVVSMGSTVASGGYYIASAADWIFANPGTLTGSIGVIMQFPRYDGLMEKVGIGRDVVKSGKYKDSGSMYRELTPEERELFQETIDDVHQQFLDAVLEGRQHAELTRESLEEVADGRIMSGRQALERKLVDELGNLDDAIKYAGELGGIEGKPRVIKVKMERSLLQRLLRDLIGSKADQIIHDHAVLRYELM